MHRHSISVLALAVASLAATPAFASDPPETAPAPAATPDPTPDDVVVTGTRTLGVTAVESAAPIKLFDEATLSRVGQPNLNQVLTQLVPSFTAQAFGGDTANLTLSARLRGLSPITRSCWSMASVATAPRTSRSLAGLIRARRPPIST